MAERNAGCAKCKHYSTFQMMPIGGVDHQCNVNMDKLYHDPITGEGRAQGFWEVYNPLTKNADCLCPDWTPRDE